MAARDRIILSMLDASGQGIEIGPGYNPMFPKSKGYNVATVDHATGDEIRRKYAEMGVDTSLVGEVDYVWRGEPLHEIVARPGSYDFVFASHVIEHIPDILAFIHSCEKLLKETGVVVLVVPDKRYCFDVFRPVATTGDLLQANLEGRRRHPPGKIFDHTAYVAWKYRGLTWTKWGKGPVEFMHPDLETARRKMEEASRSDAYEDAHGWQFVPSSFRLILNDLNSLGLTSMKEVAFHDSHGGTYEFFISFGRSGRGCPVDRLTLCNRILRESAAGHENLRPSLFSFCLRHARMFAYACKQRLLASRRPPRS